MPHNPPILKNIIQWFLSISMEYGNYHCNTFLNTFVTPKSKLGPISSRASIPLAPGSGPSSTLCLYKFDSSGCFR